MLVSLSICKETQLTQPVVGGSRLFSPARIRSALFGSALFMLLAGVNICLAQPGSKDRQAIVEHLNGIFNAFVQQDTVAIRAMHTEDWVGFQNNSRKIVNGVNEYMQNVTRNLPRLRMLDYELQDVIVQLYGEVAVVYYIAQWRSLATPTGKVLRIRARSVDIYRKQNGAWIQAGSHLSVLPSAARSGNPDCQRCFDVQVVKE